MLVIMMGKDIGMGDPQAAKDNDARDDVPLFVDLDGTLVRSDTSTESAFGLVRRNVGYVFLLPLWLLRGRAHLKDQVARRIPLDVEHLPYREGFIGFLEQERATGRRLVLATAANQRHARQVADHLGIFESVTASDETVNLEGRQKLARMKALAGGGPFDYAADDLADMVIFPHARRAIVVAPPPPLRKAAERMANIERIFEPEARIAANVLRAMRPTRWPMSLLILLPQLWPGGEGGGGWFEAGLGVIAFSLVASAGYLFDDLLHLSQRRRLPPGERGVVASGGVALQRAGMAILVFWLAAFGLALRLPGFFSLAIAGYIVLSVLAVQDWFKLPRLLTAMVLGAGRIAAGATLVTLPVPPTLWLVGLAAGAAGELLRRSKIGFI